MCLSVDNTLCVCDDAARESRQDVCVSCGAAVHPLAAGICGPCREVAQAFGTLPALEAEARAVAGVRAGVLDVRMGLLAGEYFIGDGRTFVAVNVAAGTCSCGDDACRHVQAVVEALGEMSGAGEEAAERGLEPERLASEGEIWDDAREAFMRCAPDYGGGR